MLFTLVIGPDTFKVRTLREAKELYDRRHAASGRGLDYPDGIMTGWGRRVFRITALGKIWEDREEILDNNVAMNFVQMGQILGPNPGPWPRTAKTSA